MPESKLRPFCPENDCLYYENFELLSGKYKKELEKAYKKSKKILKTHCEFVQSQIKSDHGHHSHHNHNHHHHHHHNKE